MDGRTQRILLADDHPVIATGVRLVLRQTPGCLFLGAETTPEAALARIGADRPDALILDLVFDGRVHLSLVGQSRRAVPDAAIVVFTSLPARSYRQSVLADGADAFVGKDEDLDALVAVMLGLLARPGARTSLPEADPAIAPDPESGAHLTARERELARHLSRGAPMSEIAGLLGISPKTAAVHRDNLRRKLGCRNTNELIARLARLYGGVRQP
jgi:DNA-binding NarL/FixJ family response regulator